MILIINLRLYHFKNQLLIKDNSNNPQIKPLSRTVNLLQKFGDPEDIPDTETWDT